MAPTSEEPTMATDPGPPGDTSPPSDTSPPGDTGADGTADPGAAAGPTDGFATLGLAAPLLAELAGLGYEEPTPIQSESIPPLLEGRDLLGQAATGTGKTAAFALPILDRLAHRGSDGPGGPGDPLALVLVPTRELAMQVSEAVHRYGRGLGVRVLPIFGGQPIGRQITALKRGVDVVVATPGRAIDHLHRRTLNLDGVGIVVLDEADEMLDMGFAEDLEAILEATPAERQTVLFSATMPHRIDAIARRHLTDPLRIEIRRPSAEPGDTPQVRQVVYMVPRAHKPAALGRVLDVEGPAASIVFCRTRVEVDQLTETLNGRGYRAEALHGGMDQDQRDRVMGRVRSGTADLLVATDVAARGLDIDQLTHVFNYDVPSAPEAYVHRIGRVGRAGRKGAAITLAEPREHRLLQNIERVTRQKLAIEKLPSVADLQSARIETTTATLRDALAEGDLDRFRVVVETLGDEYDIVEVALAAVKLAHASIAGSDDIEEIPDVSAPKAPKGGPGKGTKFAAKGTGGKGPGAKGGGKAGRGPGSSTTRLYIGAGREAGIRPKDLVGAIANESGLSGGDIGAIEIGDRFSLVEIPEASADEVVAALRGTKIRGKKATVRRERFERS